MSIIIKSAIVHILDVSSGMPILSDDLLVLDKDVSDYIISVIDKSFHSDDAKNCEFSSESTVWAECQTASWNVPVISQSFANELYNIMRRNENIPSSDLFMGICKIDEADYFYGLKIDYRTALTHFVESSQGKASIKIIWQKALLPSYPTKITEGFFISTQSRSAKVIEKKVLVDGIKDYYISTQLLACVESKTPRQKATKIMKVAEKVADLYYSSEDEMDVHISNIMLSELQDKQPFRVKNLSRKFFEDNPAAQEEFLSRLTVADIAPDDELSLSEKFQKKFEKQSIRTSSGVEIKIPTQVYSDANEIEFITNPDGTVSLLIKNIKI
jgi:hypothetical protein